MSDLGGLVGALLLSDQISTDRLFDSYRRAREASKLVLNDTAWRRAYDELVNRYNRLLADATHLADIQDKHIAGLEARNAALESEKKELNEALAMVRGLIAIERQMHREKHPEEYK